MKKILTVLLTVLLAFAALSITAFAESGAGAVAQMPYVEEKDGLPDEKIPDFDFPDIDGLPDGEEIPDDFYEDYYDDYEGVYGEDELPPEFEDSLFGYGAAMVLVSLLFMPALIATVIFAVLNSKTKKELKRYESMFGARGAYNPADTQGFAPNYNANYGQGGNMQ